MSSNRRLKITCVFAALSWLATAAAAEDEGKKKPDLPLEGKTVSLAFPTDEGSWLSLDVTPDGETIIFDLLGDLYSLPMSGGQATRITSGLGFDSQPVVSPDGEWLAFISDRSGSNNLWIAKPDGSDARKLSDDSQWGAISPAWMPDSQFIVVTRRSVKNELTMFHIDGGKGIKLNGVNEDEEVWGIGAEISPDGKFLYFAQGVDSNGPVKNFPATQISRYDFATGAVDQITRGEGGAVRPVLSPDGKLLVYGTRDETQTGFRVRNLQSGADRWLTYPVQRDAQENYRPPSRDLLPGYSFTPDGNAIVFNAEGKIWRVAIDSGNRTEIPFTADIEIDIGPDLTAPYPVPQGPLTATLIHDPQLAPDGENIVASVLTKLYVMDAEDGAQPRRLTSGDAWEFKPVWSPDGRWIAYVTWSMNDGGQIWRVRSNGSGRPQQLTDIPAFYTDLVYSPDGRSLLAMRGSEYMRHQTFSEFAGLGIPLELVSLPSNGGDQAVITSARGARNPHFGANADRVYLYDEAGLFSLQLDGSDRREELVVTGPRGNGLGDEPPQAEMVKISPDGRHALALVAKQVWAMPIVQSGGKAPTVDVRKPGLPAAQLTDIGADFFGWTADGSSVYWAIGHTFFLRNFDSIEFRKDEEEEQEESDDGEEDEPYVPKDEHESVRNYAFNVVVPRNTPSGSMLLRGANVITMSGATTADLHNILQNQDILVTDNRIAAIAASGSIEMPEGTKVVDVAGKFIVPGFIDTHAHWEFRTGDVLEPQNWTLTANLAYGVTAGLDVQTSNKDYLAYRDFVDTGQSVGQRAFMTALGVFGNNDFQSYEATLSYLRRYKDHYNTHNIKSYMVGNRKQQQWVILASKELALMPTTEGGGDQKMDITHAIDGMHGNEHTLPDSPIFKDVVELFARTRTAYTPTLIVQYNAQSMREYFFTRTDVHNNPKLRRFYPRNRLDELTHRRPGWQRDDEFQFRQAAAQAAKIQRAGGLVGIGAHSELQGLGYHWEMWAFEMGGMTPVEVLRAATIDGARIIGIDQDLGSIEAGKLADMVILDANPLENIRNTETIDRIVQNGRLYDGDTLDQIWPDATPLAPSWWWSEDDPRFNAGATTP
ncbi:MAG: PD40 domain-containing protein [Proteobacteria bacterium]|nr:PD40 domain-containing protein [Pseudomonadota bacterium]